MNGANNLNTKDSNETEMLNKKRNWEGMYFDLLTTHIFGERPERVQIEKNVLNKIVGYLNFPKQIEIATFVENKALRSEILHNNSIILFTGANGAGKKGDGKHDCHGNKWGYKWLKPRICGDCMGLQEGVYMEDWTRQIYFDHLINLFNCHEGDLVNVHRCKKRLRRTPMNFMENVLGYNNPDCDCRECGECQDRTVCEDMHTGHPFGKCHPSYKLKNRIICTFCMGFVGEKKYFMDWFRSMVVLGVAKDPSRFGGKQLTAKIVQYVLGGNYVEDEDYLGICTDDPYKNVYLGELEFPTTGPSGN